MLTLLIAGDQYVLSPLGHSVPLEFPGLQASLRREVQLWFRRHLRGLCAANHGNGTKLMLKGQTRR